MKKTVLIIACILSAALFFYYISIRAGTITHGFASYYTFSRILIKENNLSNAYDTAYFNSMIRAYGIEGIRDQPNNLPTSSLMYAPVAVFHPQNAKIIWTVLSAILLFASIAILLSVFNINPSSNSGIVLIIVSLLFLPVYHGFSLGQAYVFLLFLFSLSVYGLKKNNFWLLSIPLALMIVLKGYGIFPLLALAMMKKWKAAFAVISFSVIIILFTLPIIGIDTWSAYFNNVLLKFSSNEYAFFTAYQTVNSFVRHVFSLNSTVVSMIVVFSLAAISVIVLKWKLSVSESAALFFYCSFAALNVLFAPLAEDYHYALLLPLVIGTGKLLFENFKTRKAESVVFILALLLISILFNYKSLNEASFPLILLAYPVLYGGIILLALSFPRMQESVETTR